ncbi:molecular chaperone [Caulobacter flavus]|uniref:Molecular chaperone n=1 Tax=Caulobacter flavus TaxID=1679497 RepID=A0A2N5CTL0_9CAUL|nr:fimbria/pilus periplasmic chaperone [Caulobacter flavus]AYV47739.1 molecular chaperone [Caulobacter flavus]PLR15385.1 molecular chaperone [Caulobacter flavus]
MTRSKTFRGRLLGAACAGLLALAGLAAQGAPGLGGGALAMTVQPVVIDLKPTGRGMSQIVTVQNTFANPLPVELRAEELSFDEKGAHPSDTPTNDLLIFPPQAVIQPGETQSFRIQWVGDPALAQSKHYYVTVAQMPVKLPEGQSAIQILYNFQVLASVAPSGGKPALALSKSEIGADADGKPVPVVYVANTSNTHGYLSRGKLKIIEKDAAGKAVFQRTIPGPEIQQTIGFGLIAPGQTRRIAVPIELPLTAAAGGSLEAQFSSDEGR